MKITYYSKYSDVGPSSRYRAYQYSSLFRSSGIDYQISELFDEEYFNILRMHSGLRTLRKVSYVLSRFQNRKRVLQKTQGDLVIVEQQLFPYVPFAIEERYLPGEYLLEFDDAIYLTHPRKFPRMIENARGIIAGNKTLAEYALRYNKNVHIVPTVLNTDVFSPAPRRARDSVVIGWTGLEYNYGYLRWLTPVLKTLSQTHTIEIVILSKRPPGDFDFPFRFIQWDPAREAEQMNEFDIGLMPLKMDEWCKGKCGMKLLQYMSLEIPSVATPIGVNEEIIRNGENGFLAAGLSEWETALTQLILDPGLREKMGKAARFTVLESYSMRVWFPKVVELYRSYANA